MRKTYCLCRAQGCDNMACMADKASGDHLLNNGPNAGSAGGKSTSREHRRYMKRATRMGKEALGRDEMFQNQFQPKGRRLRNDD